MGLTQRAIEGFSWTLSSKLVEAAVQIGVLAGLARLVTSEDYGILGAALVVVGLATMSYQMGVAPAVIQRPSLTDGHIAAAHWFSVSGGAFLSLVVASGANVLQELFKMPGLSPVLVFISVLFLIEGMAVVPTALASRKLRFRLLATAKLISYTVGYGMVGLGLAWFGFGVWALAGAHLTQSIMHSSILRIAEPVAYSERGTARHMKELLVYGGGFSLGKLANYCATQGDNFVTGRWLGADALGFYGRAYQLIVMPATLFGRAVDRVLFPLIASIQDDRKRAGTALTTGLGLTGVLTAPLAVVLVVCAPELVQVLLGEDWTAVAFPLQLLACGLVFRTGYKVSDGFVRAIGAVYNRAARQAAYAVLVLGGTYVGAQSFGVPGVAGGTLLAITANYLLMTSLAASLAGMGFREILRPHWAPLALVLGSAPPTAGVVNFMRAGNLPSVLVLAGGSCTAALCSLLVLLLVPGLLAGTGIEPVIQQFWQLISSRAGIVGRRSG